MISTTVNPREFSQILPDERFNVDAPATNPLLAASSLDVTRTGEGLAFSVAERTEPAEPLSVERTLAEVIERCKRDVDAHPTSTRPRINLALALINGGEPDLAAEMLEGILKQEPKNYVALTSLSLLHFNHGRLDEASRTWLRLHFAYPNDPAPLINLASISLRNEDYTGASVHLEKAVALDGCSVMAKYLLAMVLLRLGKNRQSVALLRASLRDSGPSAELNQGLAIAYLVSGDFKRAERAFLTALAINEHLASAIHGLALLRLQQHRLDEVVESLVDHLNRNPNDPQGRDLLARAYVELRQFSRARVQLNLLIPAKSETVEEQAELSRIYNNIGFCFASEGKAAEAEIWLNRSVQLDRSNSTAPYTNLGRMFLSQGRFKEALGVLEEADKRNLTTQDSTLLKSAILVSLQRHDDAIAALQAFINTGNASALVYAELGWLLADWKEAYDAALLVLREGFAKDSSTSILLNNLAYVHLMRGEPAAASAVLDQLKDDSSNPVLLKATRGLLRLWEGDIEGGEELYKSAEALAFQSGLRDLAMSVRQKRHLEMARAFLRRGQMLDVLKQLESGREAKGGQRYYRYWEQLLEMGRQLNAPETNRILRLS